MFKELEKIDEPCTPDELWLQLNKVTLDAEEVTLQKITKSARTESSVGNVMQRARGKQRIIADLSSKQWSGLQDYFFLFTWPLVMPLTRKLLNQRE